MNALTRLLWISAEACNRRGDSKVDERYCGGWLRGESMAVRPVVKVEA